MNVGFFDRHGHVNSPLHRLDARAKVLTFGLGILIISSIPRESPGSAAYFLPVVLCLIFVSRVPIRHIASRALAASPIVLMAALSSVAAGSEAIALSVLVKAYAAIVLLTLLTATTRMPDLIGAFRRLGAPEALNLTLALMLRYIHLLQEEYRRLSRARESRCPVLPLRQRLSVYGKQSALLFICSWERAERTHAAMLSRGFSGTLPVLHETRFQARDAAFLTATTLAFVIIRLFA